MHRIERLDIRSSRLAAPVILGLSLFFVASAAWSEARVTQLSGNVEIGRGEPPVWEKLGTDSSIAHNDRIRTGPDGRVEIAMDAGTLRVHENSVLRLPPPEGDADRVQMDQGHSLFDVLRRAGRRFEVHTPTVVVSVKGTRFGVDASGETGEVAVYRGMVGVREAGELDATLETLVREGFVATGGPGAAIELDVAPSGDPWASWQDFSGSVHEAREARKRLKGVDRAKASLLRNTDQDVLRRAAKRNPEVAERLQEAKQKASEKKAFPASPAPRGEEEKVRDLTGLTPDAAEMRRESRALLRELRNGIRQGELAEEDFATDKGFDSSVGGAGGAMDDAFDWSVFEGGEPGLLLRIATAREDVQQQYQAAGGGWTMEEIQNALIESLVSDGMNPNTAQDLIENFLGN